MSSRSLFKDLTNKVVSEGWRSSQPDMKSISKAKVLDLFKFAKIGQLQTAYYNESRTEITIETFGDDNCWNDNDNPGQDCGCDGCNVKYHMKVHPCYLRQLDIKDGDGFILIYSIPTLVSLE